MSKAAIASFVLDITTARSRITTGVVNLFSEFANSCGNGTKDIIDVFEEGLQNPDNYVLYEPETMAGDTFVPSKKMELNKIHSKNIVEKKIEGSNVRLYKYLHFSVKYGENGDKAVLEKPDGQEFNIENEDYQHRIFHAFLAYSYEEDAQHGILILESRGTHSVKGAITKVLKNCVKTINEKRYTLNLTQFVDEKTINSYIDHNRVSKLRLFKSVPQREHGQSMHYEQTEVVYYMPRGGPLNGLLKGIYTNKYIGQKTNISEIDNFEPDMIKFEVKTEHGTRTYTSGKQNTGLIQMELPEGVVGADGVTHVAAFLDEVKRVYEEQHITL